MYTYIYKGPRNCGNIGNRSITAGQAPFFCCRDGNRTRCGNTIGNAKGGDVR